MEFLFDGIGNVSPFVLSPSFSPPEGRAPSRHGVWRGVVRCAKNRAMFRTRRGASPMGQG
jgi:hypothetical protein